jgi:predicted small integral membrane protein
VADYTDNNDSQLQEDRKGFLPIDTNLFDRFFISAVLLVALHLLWLRFIEPIGISLWFATLISVTLSVLIMWKG